MGNLQSIDLTNAAIEYDVAKVTLWQDVWYHGAANILIECRLGYDQPTGTAFGDAEEWDALAMLNMRLAQVAWQDFTTPLGRAETGSTAGASLTMLKQALPPSLVAGIMAFARRGA